MSILTLYILTMLPTMASLFGVVALLLGTGTFLGMMDSPNFKLKTKYMVILIVCSFLWVAIPSHKQMAFIAAGYIVTNNEDIKKIPGRSMEFLNKYLEEQINELDNKEKP